MKAQIMLVTLLVITILAVVVLSVVGSANRNVKQTTNSQLSERALNLSENSILQVANLVGLTNLSAAVGPSGITGCTTTSSTSIACALTDPEGNTNLEVKDTNSVTGLELRKDESLELQLAFSAATGYTGRLDFRINNFTALEFSLFYSESGQTKIINDVLDPNLIYDVSMGSSTNNTLTNHPFNLAFDNAQNSYYFTVSNIDGWTGTKIPQFLLVKVRTKASQLSTALDFFGEANLPLQIRQFTAKTLTENNNVLTKVVSQIPLRSAVANFLYQPLLVQGQVSK